MSELSIDQVREVERSLQRAVSLVGWYRRCLEDVAAGKRVRGLDEARAGYESALRSVDRLREAANA
jgi:phage terminase Nu1 subunit (DNA packaging protein)